MNKGLWVWPQDAAGQKSVARRVLASDHMMTVLRALAKSKGGMSNFEVDDALSDNSEWMTLWVMRQLTSLGFVDYKPDLFGEPGKYSLTELGAAVLTKVTGPPAPARPPAPAPVQQQPRPPDAKIQS